MKRVAASLVLMSWVSVGCVTAPTDAVVARPGSVLQVCMTAADPQFFQYAVDAKGQITLPLIGSVTVAGQTVDQVAETLLNLHDRDHHPELRILVRILN